VNIKLRSGIEIGIRAYMPGVDDPIIFAPWCNHIRRVEPFNAFNPQEFRDHKKFVLERLVAQHGVTVACHRDLPQVVHGWICHSYFEGVCHFLYVKDDFRGKGIARALLRGAMPASEQNHYYTHKTRQSLTLAKKFGFTYNPYLIDKADLPG
jgi:GNAT superfamily N-acetyltransferase